jgi:catalase
MRQTINKGKSAYFPNSLGGGCPFQTAIANGGFHSFEEKVEAKKVRGRSKSFSDHFSQPALFYRSLTEHEKRHVINAYSFELGMCRHPHIQTRMLGMIFRIDKDMAQKVAQNLGLEIPAEMEMPVNRGIGADAEGDKHEPKNVKHYLDHSKPLSQSYFPGNGIRTRQVAVLMADGVSERAFVQMKEKLDSEGAQCKVIAPHGGKIVTDEGTNIAVDKSLLVARSVQFDAVYVPGGTKSVEILMALPASLLFVNEAFKHCKPLAFEGEGIQLKEKSAIPEHYSDDLLLVETSPENFVAAIAQHRYWQREVEVNLPV